MLTKDDKKYIEDTIETHIVKALKKNNQVLVKEMVELFNVTNERIEEVNENLSQKIDKNSERIEDTNERIDRVLDSLRSDFDSIENHEKRIGKIEEKVFPISA